MSEQLIDPVVHYFDTVGHRIACGVAEFGRSTKHARAVTCPSCVARLREQAADPADAAPAPADAP